MLNAHVDSWHTGVGATDNADGTSVMMEAMRILKAIGAKPRRTIRLAIWGGEEQGLLGSKEWVKRHLEGDANKDERENFSVYLNMDNGTNKVYGFGMENNEGARVLFDKWLERHERPGHAEEHQHPHHFHGPSQFSRRRRARVQSLSGLRKIMTCALITPTWIWWITSIRTISNKPRS